MAVYRPVACALYDCYERAIITGKPLLIQWVEGDIAHSDAVCAMALETVLGEEFLSFKDSRKQVHRVRLDAIRVAD